MTENKKNNPTKTIVTAALPYANGDIHIGHLLEYIQTDIFVRFLKLTGKDVLYICASDMHGTPIEINAKKAGLEPEKFVEKYWQEHQQDFISFLIKFDNYWKTHSDENKELAEYFYSELKKKGHIYRKKIKVIYCETCQRSLPDRFVKGKCPHCQAEDQYGDICEKCNTVLKGADLVEPYCSICKNKPIEKESEHYFFKLSVFSDKLKEWINSEESWVQPEVKNWLANWLKDGLEDWCVSRDEPYFGFEIPDSKKETGSTKYFYVWLDAPIGYISSTKNYCDKNGLNWKDYWYGEKTNQPDQVNTINKSSQVYHIIGKDIAYFHYLFWPAMLMDVGIPLPKLTTHGFITVNGQKMSKSRGTFFTAKEFLKMYNPEALRFYYASHLNRKLVDVDLSLVEFKAVNNNVLMGNLGNFCYRTLIFAQKNYGTVDIVKEEQELVGKIEVLIEKVKNSYQEQDFKSAVKNILQISDLGNAYFQQSEVWKDKESEESKAKVGFCINLARNLAILVNPILPQFSKKIYTALGERELSFADLNFDWKGGLKKVEKLVEKIVKEEEMIEREVVKENEIMEEKEGKKRKVEKVSEKEEEIKKTEKKKLFPLQLKIGEIKGVEEHPDADKLFILKVDFDKEKRQVVAGLREHFTAWDLIDQKVVFCTNLKKAKIRGKMSEAMILVAIDDKKESLLSLTKAKAGEKVQFGDLTNSNKEVSFEKFKKLKMTVSKWKVVYDGEVLKGKSGEVVVEDVKDGAKIV